MNPLLQLHSSGHLPHALLLTGHPASPPGGSSLAEVALAFACALVGGYPHPDIHEYFPEGKTGMHPFGQMKQLVQEVALVPYQATHQLFLIHEAERMLPTSSNALLKTLEEPTERTILLLLTHHPQKLLPTLLSRCRLVDISASTGGSVTPHVRPPLLEVLCGKAPLSKLPDEGGFEGIATLLLLWYRDRALLNIEGGSAYLTYKEEIEVIKKYPPLPLSKVEKVLAQVKVGYERGVSWTTCLDLLALCLGGDFPVSAS